MVAQRKTGLFFLVCMHRTQMGGAWWWGCYTVAGGGSGGGGQCDGVVDGAYSRDCIFLGWV